MKDVKCGIGILPMSSQTHRLEADATVGSPQSATISIPCAAGILCPMPLEYFHARSTGLAGKRGN